MMKTSGKSVRMASIAFFFAVFLTLSASVTLMANKAKVKGQVLPILKPSGGYSQQDHVTSGFDSKKQNAANHPPNGFPSPLEKNRPEVKVIVSSVEELPGKRGGLENVVEKAGKSAECDVDRATVMSVLSDLVRNLASVQDLVNSLKYQNHLMLQQMKRIQKKPCGSSSSIPSRSPHPNHDHQMLQKDEGHYKLTGPVSAALHSNGSIRWNSASSAAEASICPAFFGYSGETDRCYRLSGERTTWKIARERCRSLKGSLVSIDSPKEQKLVNDMARSNPGTQHCDFWIGLTREGQMSGRDWFWEGDGHLPSYTNWNDQEPNNGNGDEHCTQMLWVFNWRWNDAPCSHGNACFVCETKPMPDASV